MPSARERLAAAKKMAETKRAETKVRSSTKVQRRAQYPVEEESDEPRSAPPQPEEAPEEDVSIVAQVVTGVMGSEPCNDALEEAAAQAPAQDTQLADALSRELEKHIQLAKAQSLANQTMSGRLDEMSALLEWFGHLKEEEQTERKEGSHVVVSLDKAMQQTIQQLQSQQMVSELSAQRDAIEREECTNAIERYVTTDGVAPGSSSSIYSSSASVRNSCP